MGGSSRDGRGRHRKARLLALILLVAVDACGPDVSERPPLPPPPTIVEVKMRDFRFVFAEGDGRPLPAGRVVFRAQNEGRVEHELVVLSLPDRIAGRLDAELRDPVVTPLIVVARSRPRRPRASASVAVDLPPGAYGLVCFVRASDDKTHAERGMSAEFRLR